MGRSENGRGLGERMRDSEWEREWEWVVGGVVGGGSWMG